MGSTQPAVVDRRRVKDEELGPAAKVQTSTLKPALGGTRTADTAAPPAPGVARYMRVGDILDVPLKGAALADLQVAGMGQQPAPGGKWQLVEAAPPSTPPPPPEADPSPQPSAKEPAHTDWTAYLVEDDAYCPECAGALFDTPSGRTCQWSHAPAQAGESITYTTAIEQLYEEGIDAKAAAERMWMELDPVVRQFTRWTRERRKAEKAAKEPKKAAPEPEPKKPEPKKAAPEPEPKKPEPKKAAPEEPAPTLAPIAFDSDGVVRLSPEELQHLGLLYVISISLQVPVEYADQAMREGVAAIRDTVLRERGE